MLSVSGIVGQSFTIRLTAVPADGTIDPGSIKFNVDVPVDVEVQQQPDGLSALVTMKKTGVCNISVTASSLGNQISGDNTVQTTIAIPPPPAATGLHVEAGAVS